MERDSDSGAVSKDKYLGHYCLMFSPDSALVQPANRTLVLRMFL